MLIIDEEESKVARNIFLTGTLKDIALEAS